MRLVREPSRVVASVFSLMGFVVAVAAGWRAGASASDILLGAIVCMIGCQIVGRFAGWAGEKTVQEFIEQYSTGKPVADVKGAGRALSRPEPGRPEQPVDSSVKKRAA